MKNLIVTCLLLSTFAFSGSAQPWYQVNVPTSAKLNDIDFASDMVGYIVGDSATILKTTDGGETWIKLSPTFNGIAFGNFNFHDVAFVSETIGYIVLEAGTYGTAKTTDGGQTWATIQNNNTNQCFPQSVYAFAEDDLMIGGSDCFQGTTVTQYQVPDWTVKTVNYQTGITDQFVTQFDFEGNLGVAAVNADFMLRSIDFGQTWDTVHVGLSPNDVLTSVMIASDNTIYAGYDQNGSGFGVLSSSDNGLTWEQDISSATFYYPTYYGLCESTNGKIYIGAQSSNFGEGLIFELANGAWNYYNVDQAIYALDSYGTDVTFGVGDSGYVVVNQLIANIGIEELSLAAEQLTIAPNPSNDFVKVSSNLGNLDWVEVVDVQGTLITRTRLSQTNGMLNVSGLASGVYLVQTELNGMRQVGRLVKQ